MASEPLAEREMRRLARRIRWARFAAGCADGLVALGLAGAALLLVGRLFDWAPAPSTLWLAALVLPLALGLRAAARVGFGRSSCAAYLDRRFELDGLLVTSLERDAAPWHDALRERLASARAGLPRLRAGRLLRRAALPLAVLAAVALLPRPATTATLPPAAEALDDLAARLDRVLEDGAVDVDAGTRLRERIEELRARAPEASWNDVDALTGKLAHEKALHAHGQRRTHAALAAVAQRAAAGRAGAEDHDALRKALDEAARRGLLGALPPDLLRKHGIDPNTGAAQDLPRSPEEMQRLAEALQDALGGDPGAADAPPAEPGALETLENALEEFRPAHEHGPG